MKVRYRVTRRGSRGDTLYCKDTVTGKRTSLDPKDEDAAEQIALATNQAKRQPMLNLQIARAYPERFPQLALGHNSKAVHRAYARNAKVGLPALEDYNAISAAVIQLPLPVAG